MSQADDPSLRTSPRRHRRLRASLVAELRPVRRLRAPAERVLLWLGAVMAVAAALASVADIAAMRSRLAAAPDMWLAALGSTTTVPLAALAAFELSLPDRSRRWALLPVPGLALWIGASGTGCARSWLVPGTGEVPLAGVGHCLPFIIGLSVPLSLFTGAMMRRGFPLMPGTAGALAGLAVAAATATLLNLFHPYDATVDDLVIHALAVTAVVVANRTDLVRRSASDPQGHHLTRRRTARRRTASGAAAFRED